jgi:hypothetical protein
MGAASASSPRAALAARPAVRLNLRAAGLLTPNARVLPELFQSGSPRGARFGQGQNP